MVILLLNALASLPLTVSLSLYLSLPFMCATTGLISVSRGLVVAAALHGCRAAWPWRGSFGVAWLMQPRAFTDLKARCRLRRCLPAELQPWSSNLC